MSAGVGSTEGREATAEPVLGQVGDALHEKGEEALVIEVANDQAVMRPVGALPPVDHRGAHGER